MNVGILYPRSKVHPGITQDFMDGLKSCTVQQPGINFISESIGYGGSEKEVYEKAEKLLVIEDADILVAFIGEKVLEILHPLLQTTGKLLLVVHPGANYPYSWIPQPNIIQLTLQDAFLCWLCGQQAGAEAGGGAVMATTFYDCGYLHLASMVKGYTDAGGNIVFNYVNNQAFDNGFHINEMESFLTANPGRQNVLAVFDELPASLFYDKLKSNEQAAELNLYVSPMMLQPAALVNSAAGFPFSVSGYTPWLPSEDTAGSKSFCDAFRIKSKREPGLFSVLGWETGMIVKQIFDIGMGSVFVDGIALAQQLEKITFNGPRGKLKLDAATNYFTCDFLRCHASPDTGKMTTAAQPFPADAWANYIQLPTEGSGSGWTNTYLCY